jgi:hypothetical protein
MGQGFPVVEGSSLSGTAHRLPSTLAHRLNLLLIAFRQWQQRDVDTWVPLAAELSEQNSDFGAYELPVISRGYRPFAGWIDGGMRAGIPDPAVRESTITLYIDRRDFMQALDIATTSAIVPMLVTPDGTILWRTTGAFDGEAADELRAVVGEA